MENLRRGKLLDAIAPGYSALFDELARYPRADACSFPFVPYVGKDYGKKGTRKILIVGKSTEEWPPDAEELQGKKLGEVLRAGTPNLFKLLVDDAEAFVTRRVLPYYSGREGIHSYSHFHRRLPDNTRGDFCDACGFGSPFWRRIYLIGGAVLSGAPATEYERDPKRANVVFHSIAWTNVFKVGNDKGFSGPEKGGSSSGLTTREQAQIQRKISVEILRSEIAVLDPDIILFSTGTAYDEYVEDVLGAQFLDQAPWLRYWPTTARNRCIYRTPHFQALKSVQVAELASRVQRSHDP